MTLTADRDATRTLRDALPALLSLALASALAVTTEMLPVGLLPDLGAAFGVSDSTTGLLVGLYAVMVAVFAVPLTIATSRFARKPLFMTTVAGYVISNTVVALAPTFAVVAVGRAVGGLTHALFFALLIGYTPRLVSRAHVGRALAIAGSGVSAGLVLGVPLLTSLGAAAGWRASFITLAVASVITLGLVGAVLPPVRNSRPTGKPEPGRRGMLVAVSASNLVVFVGHFSAYTFISLLLLSSGVGPAFIGPILLGCGACGLIGLWYAGKGLDRNPRRTTLILLLATVAAVALLGLGWPALVAVLGATALWCAAFGGVPSLYQACAVRTHAVSPERAGAWVNATANVGIAGGSALGAMLLDSHGLGVLPWVAVVLIAAGTAIAAMSRSAFPAQP
ncbi:MFS transporter [Mycolicibacterium sp. 018/SC-01/001]|uniref:MFS transporter n=1 Tax=Mycolicibacterium sp. 018/SC-01/001 TaxID=2592069 RepID=UPI0011803D16|nr:MFS transporter [Mycolicibacterium sp. 018/SC-01/001]TRW79340.1 MFS transporter [Mycolicibacterium sp. 018/SC-01/001]